MTIRKRVVYHGQVQGVGFRYTVNHLAAGFLVAGHVRNLPDGCVELVAEGLDSEVERFLASVGQGMGHTIERSDQYDEPVQHVQGFRIRH